MNKLFFLVLFFCGSLVYGAETLPVQDQFGKVLNSFENKEWKQLSKQCLVVMNEYPKTPFAQDSNYYLGVAYFEMADFDMANYQFTDYLTRQATPKFFEEAIQYKFEIAEKFRLGARKHLMGFKSMPKWTPAGKEALTVYDEVISALPHHDLAAHALYGKAFIHAKNKDFRSGIEAYQTLIRRFPKHPLSVESYIGVGEIYSEQSQTEYPDPDYLDLAELNLRKFKANFPREEKVAVAIENLDLMKDHYAECLYTTAKFYERTKKWGAAKIYYEKILKSYPSSRVAAMSDRRLEYVSDKYERIQAKES